MLNKLDSTNTIKMTSEDAFTSLQNSFNQTNLIEAFRQIVQTSALESLMIIFLGKKLSNASIYNVLIDISKSSQLVAQYLQKRNISNIEKEIFNKSVIDELLDFAIITRYEKCAGFLIRSEELEVNVIMMVNLVKNECNNIISRFIENDLRLANEASLLDSCIAKISEETQSEYRLRCLIELILVQRCDDIYISKLLTKFTNFTNYKTVHTLLKYKKEMLAEKLVKDVKCYHDELLSLSIQYQCHNFVLLFLRLFLNTTKDFGEACETLIKFMKNDTPSFEFYLHIWSKIYTKVDVSYIKQLLTFIEEIIESDSKYRILLISQPNPLKISILMVELIINIGVSKDNLKFKTDKIKEQMLDICCRLQDEIEDENILRDVYNDKDISNRPLLSIISSQQYLSLCKNKNFEKVVYDLWGGPFYIEGNLISSTSSIVKQLQIISASKRDEEFEIRKGVFKRKMIELKSNQYQRMSWIYGISYRFMIDFLIEITMLAFIFISMFSSNSQGTKLRSYYEEITIISQYIVPANATSSMSMIESLKNKSSEIVRLSVTFCQFASVMITMRLLFIPMICIHFLYIKFTKRSVSHLLINCIPEFLVLTVSISFTAVYFPTVMRLNPDATDIVTQLVKLVNDSYLITVIGIYLIILFVKILLLLKTNSIIGPFLTILTIIMKSLIPILCVYLGNIMVFSLAMNMVNYNVLDRNFDNLYNTVIYMFQASFNAFDYTNLNSKVHSEVFLTIFVLLNSIILMNMLIGVVSSIYSEMSEVSRQIYIIEVLRLHSILSADDNYCSMISLPSITTAVLSPFILFILGVTPKRKRPKVNSVILYFEYLIVFIPLLFLFVFLEVALFPVCYIKILITKFFLIFRGIDRSAGIRVLLFIEYLVVGLPEMIYYFIADIYIFIRHSFTSDIKKSTTVEMKEFLPRYMYKEFSVWLEEQAKLNKELSFKSIAQKCKELTHYQMDVEESQYVMQSIIKPPPLITHKESEFFNQLGGESIFVLDNDKQFKKDQSVWQYNMLIKITKNAKLIDYDGTEKINTDILINLLKSHDNISRLRKKEHLLATLDTEDIMKSYMQKMSASAAKSLSKSVDVANSNGEKIKTPRDEAHIKKSINMRLLANFNLYKALTAFLKYEHSNNKRLHYSNNRKIMKRANKIMTVLANTSDIKESKGSERKSSVYRKAKPVAEEVQYEDVLLRNIEEMEQLLQSADVKMPIETQKNK